MQQGLSEEEQKESEWMMMKKEYRTKSFNFKSQVLCMVLKFEGFEIKRLYEPWIQTARFGKITYNGGWGVQNKKTKLKDWPEEYDSMSLPSLAKNPVV